MPVPESPRVQYRKNPLQEVVCQLRYPALLRIESDLPSVFQEENRDLYPLFSEKELTSSAVQGLPPELTRVLTGLIPFRTTRIYEFSSGDQMWSLALSKDFLGLSCRRYRTWQEFRRHLVGPLQSLSRHYAPHFFSRIGLRYRNVINRSQLGLQTAKWSQLLQAHIAAELTSDVENEIEEAVHQVVFRAGPGDKVRMQHGLATADGETVYLIDNDFFTEERTETTDALPTLDRFNGLSGKFFRWSIAPELHAAMDPEPIPEPTR